MANLKVEEFLEKDIETLCGFLSCDDLKVLTEVEVFRVALGWLSHGDGRRFADIERVLKCVRFLDMTRKELVECHGIVKAMDNVLLYAAYSCSITLIMTEQIQEGINVSSTGPLRTCRSGESDLASLLKHLSGQDESCKEGKETEHVVKEKVKSNVKMNLKESIQSLQEMSEEEAVAEYKQLDVQNAERTVFVARYNRNKLRNRYKDILTYDYNRVELGNKVRNDYINASHIQMDLNETESNNYIATQGPKPETAEHFWQMVWEQHVPKVIMLTAEVENGKVKCHKYWPNYLEASNYGDLEITCTKQVQFFGFVEREFKLLQIKTREERMITQSHYLGWPDCGVPEDADLFLDFVHKIRNEHEVDEPLIVHCSAGVGRTGVFIALDTAWSLMETKRPVNPLEIVQKLREQRMKCVQTPEQYMFIINGIIKAYNEKIETHGGDTDETQPEPERKRSPWRRLINRLGNICCCCCGYSEQQQIKSLSSCGVKEKINSLRKMFVSCFSGKEKTTGKSFWKRGCSDCRHRGWCNRRVGISE